MFEDDRADGQTKLAKQCRVGHGGVWREDLVGDDGDGDAGCADVLLRATEDGGVLADVDCAGEEVGAHVCDEVHAVRSGLELDAVDGFVVAVVC